MFHVVEVDGKVKAMQEQYVTTNMLAQQIDEAIKKLKEEFTRKEAANTAKLNEAEATRAKAEEELVRVKKEAIKDQRQLWKNVKEKAIFDMKGELLRFTTAGSVDDGKSTLIGRLLYDSKSIFQDQLNSIEVSSKKKGLNEIDFSLLTDGLKDEREQGITIDVAYRYFSTNKNRLIAKTKIWRRNNNSNDNSESRRAIRP